MSFQQGLSGLNGAAKSLDVIGNNIANASTVGFKGSQAQFADVYANSLNGAGGNQAGIGSKVSQIAQQFTQGNVESSNNPLDIAINGAGFFRTSINGTAQYSRNGQFSLDKNGYMVNAQSAKLTGYLADQSGKILAGSPVPIVINTADLKPVATSKVDTLMNLDSRSLNPVKTPFDATDPTTYNKQVPVDVYDTLGNPHVMSTFYVRAGPSTWDVYVANDGTEISGQAVAAASLDKNTPEGAAALAQAAIVPFDPVAYASLAYAATNAVATAQLNSAVPPIDPAAQDAALLAASTVAGNEVGATKESIDKALAAVVTVPGRAVGRLIFDSNGVMSKSAMDQYALDQTAAGNPNVYNPLNTIPFTVPLPLFPATGATSPLSVQMNFTGTTQYGSTTSVNKITQDGYTAGHLARFSAGADGVILGQYSNGQSHALAQVILANFANPNGLSPLGNNAWAESSTSGVPLIGEPNSGSLGVLQSSAVENSNVDLTAELVNMITAQRVYQANAQTIKTQDSVLQTLVNLR